MQRQGRSSQETIVQPWGRVCSSSRNRHNKIPLSSSAGTKAPIQVEDGNFMLSTRFLEHRPVTSPPTNQKKATHPAAQTSNFAYKDFSPRTIREFGFLSMSCPFSFLSPAIIFLCSKLQCFGLLGLSGRGAHKPVFSNNLIFPASPVGFIMQFGIIQ